MSNIFDNLFIEKYRPKKLDDIILSDRNRKIIDGFKKKNDIPHLLFSGYNGIGKTSLAKIIVKDMLDCQYLYINASDKSGVDVVRDNIVNFAEKASFDGKIKVVILDEIDGLTNVANKTSSSGNKSSAQQALRNVIEEYSDTTRFIGTCNYINCVSDALLSRFQVINLDPPIDKVLDRVYTIIKKENIVLDSNDEGKLETIVKSKYPDIRKIIGDIQLNTIEGKLVFQSNIKVDNISTYILKEILSGNVLSLRQYIISNGVLFGNDHHFLLSSLFNAMYESNIADNKKVPCLLTIANSIAQHNMVMDTEINCFACLLELSNILSE